jgi:hypothetical protein
MRLSRAQLAGALAVLAVIWLITLLRLALART